MDINELFKEIETHKFSAEINLASSFDAYTKNLTTHDLVSQLTKLIENHENKTLLLRRTSSLASNSVDLRYENEFDAAFSAYLWSMFLVEPIEASILAVVILKVQNCWWASKLSNYILRNETIQTQSGISAPVNETPKVNTQQQYETGESIVHFTTFVDNLGFLKTEFETYQEYIQITPIDFQPQYCFQYSGSN